MEYTHLLISRGYAAEDDYGWMVEPENLSRYQRAKIMALFRSAYRHLKRYHYTPVMMTPTYIITLEQTIFILEFTQTDFADYQSRPIYALQGICIGVHAADKLSQVLPWLLKTRHFKTITSLQINLLEANHPASSPRLRLDPAMAYDEDHPPAIGLAHDNEVIELPYSEAGYRAFTGMLADYRADVNWFFGAPVEMPQILPEAVHVIASVNPGASHQRQTKTQTISRTAAQRATERFNPLTQTRQKPETQETASDSERAFNLLEFLRELFLR